MRFIPASTALALALAFAGTARAQDMDHPRSPEHKGTRDPRRMSPPDPVVLDGPPSPADFAKLTELPDAQLNRYSQLYQQFMTSTRPQRDSLQALRRDVRASYGSEDRSTRERRRAVAGPLLQDLQRRQAAFDDTLHTLVQADEWKRYQQWRDDQRKQAQEKRRDRWHRRSGDSLPPA